MPSSPKVLCIQHVAPETPGTIAGTLHGRGLHTDIIRTDLGQPVPATMSGAEGLVVMGGPMGVHDDHRFPHLNDEQRLIEDALSKALPVLGICLGSELLASVLGARVHRGKQKEIGWFPVTLTPEAMVTGPFAGAPPSFRVLHWHGDVFDVPADAVSLARSDLTECQAFRAGATAFGFLFHLEATRQIVEQMTHAFRAELDVELLHAADLVTGAAKHLPHTAPIAVQAFGRWADAVRGARRPS